jgi:hypothetical protein
MAVAAANVGIKIGPAGFRAARGYNDFALQKRERTLQPWLEQHELAGVSQLDIRDGAGRA